MGISHMLVTLKKEEAENDFHNIGHLTLDTCGDHVHITQSKREACSSVPP